MRYFLVLLLALAVNSIFAQTAVNMSAQPGYTYTETFADITNWTFNSSPADGTLTAGVGAAAWKGYAAPAGSGTIPNGTKITGPTNAFQGSTSTSSGVYKFTQALGLLSTGTTDNSSAVAFDLFVDFTGLNAGTLSFDWATVNNPTGNRSSSLRIYTSADGVNFTELNAAAVLNFTNYSPTSGHINYVALPSSLNGQASVQIRFYYHNGSGGTSGSRPKLSLDNVKVTAVPSTVCVTPTAQPTTLSLTPAYSSISGNFTASSPAADGYLVIASLNNSLSSNPVDGANYNLGDNVGDGTVVSFGSSTSFNISSLSPSTTYYIFVFAMNNLCSGGTKYRTTAPLTGITTTLSGSSPCTAPANQPTNLIFNNITLSSIKGTFTASASVNTDHYLVVRSTSSSLSSSPVNGTNYSGGSSLGGGVVVTKTQQNTFTANGLISGTTYYFFVFAVSEDNCTGGPVYNTTSPLTGSATTIVVPSCTTPAAQPINLQLNTNSTQITGYFNSVAADGYLIVISNSSSLGATPQNGVTYSVGNTLGTGTILANTTASGFIATNLTPGNTYYFFVFAKNDQCSGGPLYNTVSPLQASSATLGSASYGYYFGNLHAHSSYSDGNKDNTSNTPATDYAYAKNSQCMDFLGISEHNHSEAGMSLSNWPLGINAAAAATTSNFLALYGMEYGVISNGGHVLVYGVNQLLGWEASNYNVYVPKSDYIGKPPTTGTTGLFKTINDWPSTAFTLLAHPDNSDYNNIANSGLNSTADSAIAGCALESGPAFSTSTSYNDLPTRLSYYAYYKKLLSRGYHAGPSIDHDTHYTNFGRSNYSRLTVLATSLTESNFLDAMKQRRFYMTHDCDTRVSFTLNNQLMGSIATGTNYPSISVYVTDPTNPSAIATIRIMQGIAGSGLLPVVIDSLTANTFNYTDYSLANNVQAYYYAEITIGGGYVITSPVWYTKNGNITPVTLLSFKASLAQEKTVKLDWTTVNEVNNKEFIIERSADGMKFVAIDSVPGKNSLNENVYVSYDKKPLQGLNYYRLKQVDKDGKFEYSSISMVKIEGAILRFIVSPNPIKDAFKIEIESANACQCKIMIADAIGRIVKIFDMQLKQGLNQAKIDMSEQGSGNYFVVMRTGTETNIQAMVKQ